eukprot:scaffold25450_cov82-Skeletonema_dohrnii-CCMP3373.AAC.5
MIYRTTASQISCDNVHPPTSLSPSSSSSRSCSLQANDPCYNFKEVAPGGSRLAEATDYGIKGAVCAH